MVSLPIHWIEVRTYCHATEEERRVDQALAFACPNGTTSRERLDGHFGNPLVRLARRLESSKEIRATWDHWSTSGLPPQLNESVNARVDEDGVFHFRLDKQAAFQGRLALAKDADTIDVRLKLLAYPAKPDRARRVARSILGEAK